MSNNDMDAVKGDLLATVFAGEDDLPDENEDILKSVSGEDDDDIPAGGTIEDDDQDDLDEGSDEDPSDVLLREGDEEQQQQQKPKARKVEKGRKATEPVGNRSEQLSLTPQQISGKYQTDRNDNVVMNGQIIAKAGTERKVFEMFRNSFEQSNAQQMAMTEHIHKVVAAGKELNRRYQDLQANKNYGERIGLDETETRQALDIAALAKNDPKSAVKKFLTLMQLNGTTIEDIGTDVPLDAKTVAEQAVADYIKREKAEAAKKDPEPTTGNVDDPVFKEAKDFLDRNPQASKFVVQLDEAKAKFPHLTYDQCWDLLKKGIQRAQQKQQQTRGKPKNAPSDPGTSAPRGRKRTISSRNVTPDPNQSFKQIGADLLKELRTQE